jgi:hypothetical protein
MSALGFWSGWAKLSKACFKNGCRNSVAIPQGLKPLAFSALFGTTEAVP